MKTAIRYYTRSGNTEKLAKAVSQALDVPAETVAVPLEEKTELLFLGCSYYAFDMDPCVKQFLRDNRENIGRVVCFGTSAMMRSMKRPMQKVLRELHIPLAEEEFHCRGAFHRAHPGRPNEKDCLAVQTFARAAAEKY